MNPALPKILAIACWIAALIVDVHGFRLIVAGARAAGHPDQSRMVVRGFRRLILGGGFIFVGIGFFTGNGLWHVIGGVFLLEEAVETGFMKWMLEKRR